MKYLFLFLSITLTSNGFAQQKVVEFSLYERLKLGPILMESTFYIYDPLNVDKAGTCFLLAHVMCVDTLSKDIDSTYTRINKRESTKYNKFSYCEILVTAAHVLKAIEGDYAHIILRRKKDGAYETFDYTLRIRENGHQLWRQADNEVDVAAMVVMMPKDAVYSILIDHYLLSSKTLDDIKLNAGDDISCLGFPYRTPSDNRYFPILRSGKYASYRSPNTLNDNSFLFDFRIYPGNSGGPVFTDLKISVTKDALPWYTTAGILGVVTEQLKSNDKMYVIEVAKVITSEYILNSIIGLTVPLSYIKEYDIKKYK